MSHDITDSFWTPFEEQEVKVGETNTFTIKVFADKKLKVQEFLFGIPNVGDAHKVELGIEVFFNYDGDFEKVKVIQKSDIVDNESIKVTTSKSKCLSDDLIERCVTTNLSMKFLEPLQDKIMAMKAIDFKNRVLITYLNDGFNISGDSLNPMKTMMIAGTEKYEGLVEVTQTAKYSNIWSTQDGRDFEINSFGSSKQIHQSFEHHVDTRALKDRMYSEFYKLINYETNRAQLVLEIFCKHCTDESYDKIDEVFAYEYQDKISKYYDAKEQLLLISEDLKAKKILNKILE